MYNKNKYINYILIIYKNKKMNTINYYDKNILNIHYYKKNKENKIIKFKNNTINKEINIKTKDINNNSILELINETNDKSLKQISFMPFDTINLLKKKISMIFNIDWYKITIYWKKNNIIETSYDLIINENIININFNNIEEKDSYIYDNKNNINIKSKDEILTVNYLITNNIKDIYFIYLDDYITELLGPEMERNIQKFDIIYNNIVIKYFPLFTYDLFYNYIFYNKDFNNKYTNLSNIKNEIKMNNNIKKILDKGHNYKINNYSIAKIIFTLNNILITDIYINLRNIFDLLHINEYNITKIILNKDNKIYRKKLKYETEERNKEYKSETHINVITIYLRNKYSEMTPLFLKIHNKGRIEIIITIADRYKLKYNDIIKYIQSEINPILEKLDEHKYIFNIYTQIKQLTDDNIKNNKNKYIITEKIEDKRFDELKNINILMNEISTFTNVFSNVNKDINDVIRFHIYTGINSLNVEHYHDFFPNVKNSYIIYSSLKEMNQWREKFPGLITKLIYNMNTLEINIKLINYNDIENILYLLKALIHNTQIPKSVIKNTIKNSKDKKLKKLKNIDSNMFSFNNSNQSNKKYSKICQRPFHPLIYKKEEIKDLSKKKKEELIEFINTTTNEKVYYRCDTKKAPYLGFITNEHPQNYCIPCCRIKNQEIKETHGTCLENYKILKKKEMTNKYIQTYILQHIDTNRLSKLPYILNMIINKSLKKKYINTKNFYIYGLEGKINLINFCMNINIDNIDLIHKYQINLIIFDNKGNINIDYYFPDYNSYILIYDIDNKSYPIINSFDLKVYNNSHDIIKFIKDIIKKNENLNNTFFFHFEYIQKNFDIIKIFVNNKNFIYGVLIKFNKSELYLPIIYYFNITIKYKIEKYISNNIINNISEHTLINFFKKFNLLHFISNYIFSNILKKYIGINILFNDYSLCFLFKPINENIISLDLDVINTITIYYPIHDISDSIINNNYDINITSFKLDLYDIYYKNLYKLIINEISFYFLNKKDINKRSEIVDIINKNSIFNKILFILQEKFPSDFIQIELIINNFFKINDNIIIKTNNILKEFSDSLYNTHFNFDNDIKHDFIKNSSFSHISDLFDKLFVFKNKKDIHIKNDIKNILIPCSLNLQPDFCDKKKLIIPFEFKNKFINLFYYDIKNNFINKHLLDKIIHIQDDFYFDIHPNEVITINYF